MDSRSKYLPGLDLCRGLAAVGVLVFHVGGFLFFETPQKVLPRAYLCVDLFFLLSGYVISHSYDQKLAHGIRLVDFFWIRVARLWPLVLLSCLVGFVGMTARTYSQVGTLNLLPSLLDLTSNVLLLPAIMAAFMFPFNPAAWSIFYEMVVNVIYAAVFNWLNMWRIGLVVVVSGIFLAIVAILNNSLDVGVFTSHFFLVLPRVVFSFFLGVLIFRLNVAAHISSGLCTHLLGPIIFLTILLLSVPAAQSQPWAGLYDLGIDVVLFPLLIICSVRARLSPAVSSFGYVLGGMSYSVYLLHTPLFVLFSGLPQVFLGMKIGQLAPWGGIVFLPFIFATAYLTWMYFERPAQKIMRRMWQPEGVSQSNLSAKARRV